MTRHDPMILVPGSWNSGALPLRHNISPSIPLLLLLASSFSYITVPCHRSLAKQKRGGPGWNISCILHINARLCFFVP
ncbi:hypothetical protein K469DRAFT_704954 [Zopfia rhizophila CBS 207.26]|uniref:Uncharacterized protein n=1 Tax=Zopfia rhizophila CBS 207.26 TaxID=1314779 RepID=A0A6A6E812_9PEZI|nr:hypothetical protein K469DRAFT_704954 [Zopfia rhizophila CBS 207.26]